MRTRLIAVVLAVALGACNEMAEMERKAPPPKPPWTAAAIAHGGTGSTPRDSDGCRRAVDAALAALERGGNPLDAAVAGVVVLEDDPRFNAGTGSRVRIDGETVQMDAAVMTSDGAFGAVAAIERVRNPVRVARAVFDSPHLLIAGDGATRLARSLGLADYDPATDASRAQTQRVIEALRTGASSKAPQRWREFDWREHWNFERTLKEAGVDESDVGTDTVGVAVRASDGHFAVALSTGGTAITLRGRVGDVPLLGAGLYAGRYGAAAATGSGERIIEAGLARRVHDWLKRGASANDAAKRAVDQLKNKGSVGIITVSATDLAAASNRKMAWAARELGSSEWHGPSR